MINDPGKAGKYHFNYWKIGILTIAAAYFLNIALRYPEWSFLDNVNLIIHEAGHFILGFFGNRFLTVAGGTLLQVFMPLIFVLYFYFTDQRFSGALTMFWLGQSLLNVSIYAGDAVQEKLPLLGGDGTIHDWKYLLSNLNLLPSTDFIAGAIHNIGIVIFFIAIISGLFSSQKRKESGFV